MVKEFGGCGCERHASITFMHLIILSLFDIRVIFAQCAAKLTLKIFGMPPLKRGVVPIPRYATEVRSTPNNPNCISACLGFFAPDLAGNSVLHSPSSYI